MNASAGMVLSLFALAGSGLAAQERSWQELSNATAAEVAGNFAAPPTVYSSQVTWGWSGVITREVIARDLDRLLAMNIHQAWVEPGRNPEAPYLSDAYFENVKIAVAEAKKRGMHLWFDDDGGYPSGFAGGKFTLERPDLRMKGLAPAGQRVPIELVNPGQVFSRAVDEYTICAVALNLDDVGSVNSAETKVIEIRGGQVEWTAPASGHWAVALPRWVYRSGVTKSANNKSGAKDSEHSLMDYLSPEAGKQFIEWTFEAYKKAVGEEFGKTFVGFRGDEAAYNFNPWTPDFPAEFQKRKGYDIRAYLQAIQTMQIGRPNAAAGADNLDAAARAYADYCDVWSDLFAENFFSAGARWAAANHLAMQVHIEHEEILPQLASANGDYFKAMRDMQVPGVDVIWHQLWHDVVADYPKLASSAAHLGGRPQSMSESFAAMSGNYPTPNLDEIGWILHHQVALGITHFEYMFMGASTSGRAVGPSGGQAVAQSGSPVATGLARGVATPGYRYLNDPLFPALAQQINRVTYVLGQGRPAAQVAVFIPSSSFWFGGAANRGFLAAVHSLLEHQRDVDFVDDYALVKSLRLQGGKLVNLSGQAYGAVVIPASDAISKAALENLRAFARTGGTVIVLGETPRLVVDRNFLTAAGPAEMGWAVLEPSGEVTARVLAALPASDLSIDQPAPALKYNHRRLADADVYYLFNEGESALKLNASLAVGENAQPEVATWDEKTGSIGRAPGAKLAAGRVNLPIELEPWATKLMVIPLRDPSAR